MLEKIKFSYIKSIKQDELFTPYHTKFYYTIKYNEKYLSFPYQCNTSYTMPNLKDCLNCLLLDASCWDDYKNLEDFANEFGYDLYEDYKRVNKIFLACKAASKGLHRVFTDAEIEQLYTELEDY